MLELYRAERHRLRAEQLSLEVQDVLNESEQHLAAGGTSEALRLVGLARDLDARASRHVHKAYALLERVGL
jgi:predicted component of type VI protein secretion system